MYGHGHDTRVTWCDGRVPPSAPPFPWVGVATPAVLGLALWAFTGSPLALIGAILGPAMLLANWGDAIRRNRRDDMRRVANSRLQAESSARDAWGELTESRRKENRISPPIGEIASHADWIPPMDGRTHIRIGSTTRNGMTGFPWLVDVSRGVAVVGEGPIADAIWTSLRVHISASHGAGEGTTVVTWPNGIRIQRGTTDSAQLTIRCSTSEVESITMRGGLPERGEWAADAVVGWERILARIGEQSRFVEWADRERCGHGIGVADGVPFTLDVTSRTPHVAVFGRTGSGKSEFLAALVSDWAERFRPRDLSWVGIDFKGGATLGPFAELPNCSAVITDLDGALVERALLGISAEMSERERALAREGVSRVDDSVNLGRLVVVVDELPELFRQFPYAVDLCADIARRGRSLGVHLVVATQHLSPLSREGIVGNISVRVCFPLNGSHDVTTVLGSMPVVHPAVGRPVIGDGEGTPRSVVVRHGASVDLVRPLDGHRRQPPWNEPLRPPVRGADGFGRYDDIRLRDQSPARWSPTHGDIVVVGKRRSGRTTAIRALIAGRPCTWVSSVAELLTARDVVVVDDLDRLTDSLPEPQRYELPAIIASRRLEREPPVFVLSVSVWSPRLHGLVPNVLTLATPTRDSHIATGEPAETFDPSAEPGVGSWRGRRVVVYASTDSIVTDAIP